MISELRQQVAGKQGKFIKVSGGLGGRSNKHERGKHKSDKAASHWAQSQSPLTGDYFPSQPTPSGEHHGRSKVTERNRNKANQAGVETRSSQVPQPNRQSRSKSLDVLQHRPQPPGHRDRRPRGSNLDLSDLSEEEKPQQSRSRSRQKGVRECNGWFINNQHQPHQTPQNNSR